MSKKVVVLGCMGIGILLSAQISEGQSEVTVDAEVSIYSAYVWRGQVINDELVAQPSLTASKGGFSFNAWGNFDLTDNIETTSSTDTEGEFSEIDLTLSYALPLDGDVSVEVGYIEYIFPKQGDSEQATVVEDTDTREVYVSAGLDVPLAPTLSANWDVDEADGGLYLTLGLSHSVDLVEESLSAELGFSISYATEDYNEFYFGVNDDEWNDGNISLSTTYSANESCSITGLIQYSWLIDSTIERAAKATYFDDNELWGGITLAHAF